MTDIEIKRAALLNFVEKGYEGTSLSDIANAVGIKKQSIYTHFKSKDDLFICVSDEVIKQEINFMQHFFNQECIDIKDYLNQFVFQIKERYVENKEGNMKFVLRMAFMPPLNLKEKVIRSFNLYFLELENLVYKLFSNTEGYKDCAKSSTLCFMTMLDGLIVALIYGGVERFNEKFEASWKIYWKVVKK